MYRKDLIRRVTSVMREKDIRKPVSSPKHVFHISDDEGNHKDFVVRKVDKGVLFTNDDVAAVLDTCLAVIEETIKAGGYVSIRGFGALGLKYRKPRSINRIETGEKIDIEGRFFPKFTIGKDLRMCAKVYELSLTDAENAEINQNLPIFYDLDDGDSDEMDGGNDAS